MRRSLRSLIPAAPSRKVSIHIATFLVTVSGLTACQTQIQQPSDLLFAPTFSKSEAYTPHPWGTQYDCRKFQGSGWKGITGGTVKDFGRRRQISQAACFKKKSECEAYVTLMRRYIDQPKFMGCRPIGA